MSTVCVLMTADMVLNSLFRTKLQIHSKVGATCFVEFRIQCLVCIDDSRNDDTKVGNTERKASRELL
jgi:hypothetical protein